MTVYVYWIHFDNHSDIFKEGYVGVTSDIKRRFKAHSHKSNKDNKTLLESIENGAKLTVINQFENRKEALDLERYYRPKANIGWNIIPGGIDPPKQYGRSYIRKIGLKASQETKNKMSKSHKGLFWFNDGFKNIKSKTCPEGFNPGKLPHKTYKLINKTNIGKSGIEVFTPLGLFSTIKEASIAHNMSWDKVNSRIKNNKYPDWGKTHNKI